MALSATVTWELRTAGNDANGGGFDAVSGVPGTDFSIFDAAQVAYSDLVIDATTNTDATSAANPFTAAHVGNIINVTGGTGFTVQRVQIMSVTAGVARMDKSLGTLSSTGGTGNLGGALLTPGLCGSLMVAGNDVYQKAGTYTVTSATPNIAGGCVTMPAGASAANTSKWFGYQTTRGDGGTKPVIKADGVITTFALFTTGTNNHVENIEVDGNSRTSSRGFFAGSTNSRFYRCTAKNCTNNGFSATTGNNWAILCDATGCATQPALVNLSCNSCVAYNNSGNGFSSASGTLWVGCIASNNAGAGFGVVGSGTVGIHCTAYGNGTSGFSRTAASGVSSLVNCLAVNSGTYGYTGNAADDNFYLFNCAAYTPSGTGNVNASFIPAAQQIGFVALSGDPFNNAAGNDFSLNMTANAGNLARQGGLAGVFPGISTTGYSDIGAVQEGGVRTADIAAIADQVWDEARAGHVAAGSFGEGVVTNSIAANAITATAIATDAITAGKIAADAIGASELAAGAVTEIVDALKADTEWKTILANANGNWVFTPPASLPGDGTLVLKDKADVVTLGTFTITFDADGFATVRVSA